MIQTDLKVYVNILLFTLIGMQLFARADRFRVVWQDDPATSVIIAWDQQSGEDPVLHLDINDYGKDADAYALKKRPDRAERSKGMYNHFVRLKGLLPGTRYYFLVKDSEGLSRQLFFRTAPNTPDERLSIIAGGDSRNYRGARQEANLMVSKLRPHCVLFGGDFTAGDSTEEWKNWLDDWQLTISDDGRITPIIPARGNHEESNNTLHEIFDVRTPGAYYALTLGGDLIRIYTLNTMIPVGGDQRDWLANDLQRNGTVTWKIAQYHHPMRPHTQRKSEKHDQVVNWAPLFLQYNVNMAVECDAHVVKSTYPIRPGRGPESVEGFVRDDHQGTVYVGEGCWGAPLRDANDDKPWTRASGSFNQFHWIFVDQEKIEVRFVITDGAKRVASINPDNIFKAPVGLNVWNPPTGDVVTIEKQEGIFPSPGGEILAARGYAMKPQPRPRGVIGASMIDETGDWEKCPVVAPTGADDKVMVKYALQDKSNVVIRIVDRRLQEVSRMELTNQPPGEHLKALRTAHLPAGRYLAIIKENGRVVQRYRLHKR